MTWDMKCLQDCVTLGVVVTPRRHRLLYSFGALSTLNKHELQHTERREAFELRHSIWPLWSLITLRGCTALATSSIQYIILPLDLSAGNHVCPSAGPLFFYIKYPSTQLCHLRPPWMSTLTGNAVPAKLRVSSILERWRAK